MSYSKYVNKKNKYKKLRLSAYSKYQRLYTFYTSTGSGAEWAEYCLIIGTGYWVQGFFLSSIVQSVCQRAFNLLEIRCQRPWFESCIHQRKTTCLHSIRKSLACDRASKLTTTSNNFVFNNYEWDNRSKAMLDKISLHKLALICTIKVIILQETTDNS